MLPGHLIDSFWGEVGDELAKSTPLTPPQIPPAIDRDRKRLDGHGAGEAVYHREPIDVADAIRVGGFLTAC